MDLITLLAFTGIIAFATYVQTVTGFALGMIVMGTVTAINLVPIAFTAVVISAVTLINGLFALKGNLKAVDWRKVMLTTAGILPGVIAGLILLDYMSEEFSELLQLLLGITIILGGLMIMLKPQPLENRPRIWRSPPPAPPPVFWPACLVWRGHRWCICFIASHSNC
ncbi:TSUP family transporter [Aliamphritea spongicola]|nr:TSUP family transporter [Aliamphritea spongicola]